MNLAKIQSAITAYNIWLEKTKQHPQVHLWESQQIFQTNWKPEGGDSAAMFQNSFDNTFTRRIWHTEHSYPKKMMHTFWQFDPQTVKSMFDDLFNETRDIEARVGRFLFGCDMLLSDYKRANPTSIENNHYHADFRMISLYLAFRYPEQYTLYDFDIFQKMMTHVGARDLPQVNDIGRYFKVMRTLMTFIEKDGKTTRLIQKHLNPRHHFTGQNQMLVWDLCRHTVMPDFRW